MTRNFQPKKDSIFNYAKGCFQDQLDVQLSINERSVSLANPADSLLMSDAESFASRTLKNISKSRDGSPTNYIKFKVSDRDTMASL